MTDFPSNKELRSEKWVRFVGMFGLQCLKRCLQVANPVSECFILFVELLCVG